MSNMDAQPGTTRRSRRTRLAGATALAGALVAGSVLTTAASAGADTIINPDCPVPTSVVFTSTGSGASGIYPDRVQFRYWQGTYNGVLYSGVTEKYKGGGGAAMIAPNLVTPAIRAQYGLIIASCEPV